MFHPIRSLRLTAVLESYARIRGKLYRTPVLESASVSELVNDTLHAQFPAVHLPRMKLFFKCENFQKSGSFKFRGATNFLDKLKDSDLRSGVVTYSTGNHAKALALAARIASEERGYDIPVYVVMSPNSSQDKVQSLRQLGAEIFVTGGTPEDLELKAIEIQRRMGTVLVPPSDHSDIIAGQGTAILEFLQQVKDLDQEPLDALVMPSGGGGLLTGAAIVCQSSGVKVFGSEPWQAGPCLAQARKTGIRVSDVDSCTLADGLRVPVGKASFELLSKTQYVNDVFTVTEEQIRDAMRLAVAFLGIMVEPSAAVALAAVLHNQHFHEYAAENGGRGRIGIVLTGCNVSMDVLRSVLGH